MSRVAVLGGGSWGLTLASLIDPAKAQVVVWDRTPEKVQFYRQHQPIEKPIAITLPTTLTYTSDLNEAIEGADVILLVVTASGTRSVMTQLVACPNFSTNTILLNCSKGIEYPSLQPLLAVIEEIASHNPTAVLSGPNLAPEIVKGLPTAGVVASKNEETATRLQLLLTTDRFRLYTNTDTIGVQLAGALKNVFAICSGYMDARKLGDNAKATLITRGLAEINRFCLALGAQPDTLFGLSGLGDLLATCNSPLSRNYQVGFQLAQGKPLETILAELGAVAEGVKTTQAISQMADERGIDMPIVKLVEQALAQSLSEELMIQALMRRKLRAEENQ